MSQEPREDLIIDEKKLEIQTIDEDDLETYRNDRDFNYTEETIEESAVDRFFDWLWNGLRQILEAIFGSGNVGQILYFIFNILPYVILALLVFLLIRFFLRVNSRNILPNKKNTPLVHFTEEDQLIKHEDIKALINEAIKQKNYRLAIRYYYLLTLKTLSDNNLITWEQQKTNNDYIAELKEDSLKSQFENLTLIYDYVWYGEFTVDRLHFASLQHSFDALNNNIRGDQ
jgi:hypothetical protein